MQWIPLDRPISESSTQSAFQRELSHLEKVVAQIQDIVAETHGFFMQVLDLPDDYPTDDPNPGQRCMLLSTQDYPLQMPGEIEQKLNASFQATAGFTDFWEAKRWSERMGLVLLGIIPLVKDAIDRRSLLINVVPVSSVSVGNIRSPIKGNQAQSSEYFVVDVICPLQFIFMLPKDDIFGFGF